MSNSEMKFEDAHAFLWQFPDAMEAYLKEFAEMREEGYAKIRVAKQKDQDTEWILGEMMGIDSCLARLEQNVTDEFTETDPQ